MLFDNLSHYLDEICRLSQKKTRLAAYRAGREGDVDTHLAQEIRRLEEEFFAVGEAALEKGPFLPLHYLLTITGCGSFESHCVMMGLSYELGYPSQADCALINGSETQPALTPKLLVWSWQETPDPETVFDAFRESGLLMQVFFHREGTASPFLEQHLCLKTRIRDFLFGSLDLSGDTAHVIGPCFPDGDLPPLDRWQPDVAVLLDQDTDVAQLWGAAGSGRCFCARTACGKMGRRCFPVYPEEAFAGGWTPAVTAEGILLETLLFQALPVLRIPQRWEKEGQWQWLGAVIRSLVRRIRPIFLTSPQKLEIWDTGPKLCVQSFEVGAMGAAQAGRVWKEEAKPYAFADGLHPEDMANLFPFTRGQIREALRNAAHDARRSRAERIDRDNMRRGCYGLFESQLVKRAVRVPCVYRWDDLILPKPQKDKLQAAAVHVRRKRQVYEEWGFGRKMPYGQGLGMIFAGSPGTGKTMAAQVFAGELGLELYKVDLSAVVSKYVGETEKNLNEIFGQAEKSRIVLLFDEADVLFSKRTEVKEANDKYSNMEAAFLLQKIESYEGVTVLATNLIQNFDDAFKRRMKFVVEFPFPAKDERMEIWQRAIPDEMPTEELDYEYLARAFEFSGSNVRNTILHGAFLAAEREKALGMEEILQGVKNEYAKNGKTLTREELGEYYMLLPEIG